MQDPVWGSISLGVAFCIECSGVHPSDAHPTAIRRPSDTHPTQVHRSLGAHLSKVRSFQLDVLEDSIMEILFQIGNEKANAIWEVHPTAIRHLSDAHLTCI